MVAPFPFLIFVVVPQLLKEVRGGRSQRCEGVLRKDRERSYYHLNTDAHSCRWRGLDHIMMHAARLSLCHFLPTTRSMNERRRTDWLFRSTWMCQRSKVNLREAVSRPSANAASYAPRTSEASTGPKNRGTTLQRETPQPRGWRGQATLGWFGEGIGLVC